MLPEARLRQFVRILLKGAAGTRVADRYQIAEGGRSAPAEAVLQLIGSGALDGDEVCCRANSETPAWLRRAQLEKEEPLADQHRLVTRSIDGTKLNQAESPLARLAIATSGSEAFLERHHVEAGERVRRIVHRAQLQPRLTMAYSASHVIGAGANYGAEISDLAADARREIASIHRLLPHDCAEVVIDVCGFLKGLQQVEQDRCWPRRSAKLVLRIGLEQLAKHYGLGPFARGESPGRTQTWMEPGARPTRFE